MELVKRFLENELRLDPSLYLYKFIIYEKLLLEWNAKVNLVSRKSSSIEDHILNSIFFLTKYKFDKNKSVADIGTGGGFPGIPLKILFPEIEFVLIDSIQKKMTAVKEILSKMDFERIHAECGRAEDISKKNSYMGKYDTVISKAVAPLEKLYIWSRPFLKKNGVILCIKGGNIGDEIAALKKLKYKFQVKVINFDFEELYKIEDKKLVIIS